MAKRRDPDPPLHIPPRLRRQMRIADTAAVIVVAGVAAAACWVATHPIPHADVPLPLYWVPRAPIHEARTLATTMAAAFSAVLACHLNPTYPLIRWVARKKKPEIAGEHHWLWGIFTPALRQSTMRVATLAAGIIGIALWHYGLDGMDGLNAAIPSLWMLGFIAFGMLLLFGSMRRVWRVGLSISLAVLALQAGIAAAGRALAAVGGAA